MALWQCAFEQRILYLIRGEKMHNLSNNNQLIQNNNMRLGSLVKQHLLFSLVHLILC
jgi:hypothetical protein